MASKVPDPLKRLLTCRPASREVEDVLLHIGSIPPPAANIEAFWAEGNAVARNFLSSRAPAGSLAPLQPMPKKGPSNSVARASLVLVLYRRLCAATRRARARVHCLWAAIHCVRRWVADNSCITSGIPPSTRAEVLCRFSLGVCTVRNRRIKKP